MMMTMYDDWWNVLNMLSVGGCVIIVDVGMCIDDVVAGFCRQTLEYPLIDTVHVVISVLIHMCHPPFPLQCTEGVMLELSVI